MVESLLLFALFAFVGIATPGPTVLLALSNGTRLGVRGSLPRSGPAPLNTIRG